MFKIKIKAFKATDDSLLCNKYIDGHQKLLEAYGVTKVTSASKQWTVDPNTYVIIAVSQQNNKIFGGARIQIADGINKLPIEEALTDKDPSIHHLIRQYISSGTGELCGLWNSREVAGMGIGSVFLSRAGIAILTQLYAGSLFALGASYTVPMAEKVGFVIEKSLGNNGTFYYPKEDFIATALILKDPEALTTADPGDREIINNLRINPQQSMIEEGKRGSVEIEYDLLIS